MMAGHTPRISANPPMITHADQTKSLAADAAQPLLSAFLEKSRKAPYLHPDAWLFSDGVKFGPKAGPSGGWVIHHLRRIEAGLRGETLEAESKEELIAKFGEDVVPDAHAVYAEAVPNDGDDTRVDQAIEATEAGMDTSEMSDKKRRKQEKKDRVEKEKAAKKIKLDDSNTVASGANTPYQDSMVGYGDQWHKADGENGEWQDAEEYEQQQKVLEGDMADRDPTHGRQATSPPTVVRHDNKGEVIVPKQQKTAESKAERKAAKKARRREEKEAEDKAKTAGKG